MEVSAWRQTVGVQRDAQPDRRAYGRRETAPASIEHHVPYNSDRYDPPRSTQPPPSPPTSQSSRPSLPSISSLLGYSLGKRDASDMDESPPKRQMVAYPTVAQHSYSSSWRASSEATGSRDIRLPPTPPLRPRSVEGGAQTPTVSSAPTYDINKYNHLRTASVDRVHHQPSHTSSYSYPHPSSASPDTESRRRYYPSSVSSDPAPSSHHHHHHRGSNASADSLPGDTSPQSHSWSQQQQHHHYLGPSAAAATNAFPPTQERYVCPSCSKAFSRPSSLKIHSHSHTGEKPFKCKHAGCGKAFSVRSNMKRHERGCHAAVSLAVAGMRVPSAPLVPARDHRPLQPAGLV